MYIEVGKVNKINMADGLTGRLKVKGRFNNKFKCQIHSQQFHFSFFFLKN